MRTIRTLAICLALGLPLSLTVANASLAQRQVGGRAGMPHCAGSRCSQASGFVVGVGNIETSNPVAANAATVNDIHDPDWIALPVVAAHYPELAFRQKASGMVVLHCSVRAEGYLEGCGVTSEKPANLGFRKAALDMVPLYQMRQSTRDGTPVEGKTIDVPIVFDLPPA